MTENKAVIELKLLRERMANISQGKAAPEEYSFLDGEFVEALDLAISKMDQTEGGKTA